MKKVLLLLLLYINTFFPFAQDQHQSFSCGVNDAVLSKEILEQMKMAPIWLKQRASARVATKELYICRMAIEIDSDTYEQFNRDTTFIKYEVYKQIERISKIYEKEINTQLVVTYIHIWKDATQDPYRGVKDIFKMLDIVDNTWENNNALKPLSSRYDKVMYMVSKGFIGAGGIAFLGGRASVVPLGDNGNSKGIIVAAHELGHNFGSPHTQNCSWPGGVIDYCYPAESNCYQDAIEAIRGSIMSYCSIYIPTFHPLCQAVMQNHAAYSFQRVNTIPTVPVLPSLSTFDNNTIFTWESIPSAEKYQVEISQMADFSTKLSSDSSSINAYNFKAFKNNQQYFIRVKAINRFGESAWSNVNTLFIPDATLLPPTLTFPLHKAANLVRNDILTLRFSPVPFAKAYEVEVTSYDDQFFKNPIQKQTVTTNEFTFKTTYYEALLWRVRAVGETTKSAWSEMNIMWLRESGAEVIMLPNNGVNLPLTFPIGYSGNLNIAGATIRFTISLKEDFSDVVQTKSFPPTQHPSNYYVYMAENLSPNTDYFVRVEEIYKQGDGYEYSRNVPIGVLFQYNRKFRTGNTKISNQWSFFNNDKISTFARDVSSFTVGTNSIYIKNSRGLVRISTDSLTTNILDRNSTNGSIGNRILGLSTVNSDNSLLVMNITSKFKDYDEAFAQTAYSLIKMDQQTGKKITELDISNPENTYLTSADIKNNLIFGYAGGNYTLSRIIDRKITTILKLNISDKSFSRMDWNSDYAWYEVYDSIKETWELWRYDLNNKTYTVFNKENTPILGNYIEESKLDSKGNLWAIVSNNGIKLLIKFDGTTWKVFDNNNSLISNPNKLGIDQNDNIYLVDNVRILKYDHVNWKNLGEFPPLANYSLAQEMYIDNFGKIWFSNVFGLLRFNPCETTVTKPDLSAQKITMEFGENNLLVAKGCKNVMWNWQNANESVKDQLKLSTNVLNISPTINTTYTAQCYDDGCVSKEMDLKVNVLPVLTIGNVSKKQVCQGDSIKASPKIAGQFDSNNQFKVYLSTDKVNTPISFTKVNEDKDFLFSLSKSLPEGKYYLKLESSSPKTISKDSIEVTILKLPTIITKNITACVGTEINLNATGGGKYVWKGPNNFNSTLQNPNITNIVSANAGAYAVEVTGENGCKNTSSVEVIINPNPIVKTSISSNTTGGIIYTGTDIQLSASGGNSYHWDGPNNYISNEQNPILMSVKIEDGGIYKVSVTDKNGCITKSQIELKVELILSNQSEPNKEFKVFPNPANGIIQVQTDMEGYTTFYLYDALGREVLSNTFIKQTTIIVDGLRQGTYYLKFQQKEQKGITKIVLE